MIKINQKSKPGTAAVIVPLEAKRAQLYSARLLTISHMGGYPSALHVIGRLQRQFKVDSYENMLHSIKKLRDITRITADVIDSMEGVKADRYQLNRTEIITYVDNVTQGAATADLDDDDKDLVANLITSFEANPNSWMLDGGEPEGNLHLAFAALYKSVLTGNASLDLPVYSPHDDVVSSLGKMPQFTKLAKKKKPEDVVDDSERDAAVIYSFAAARIIDHVYQLLLDKDIWYSFVSPRAKAEVASNLERAKSLKTFSLYLQNLLSYNQFFTLELFMKGYDLIQKWITAFPPLEASTVYKLENIVRPHDILDAKGDVDTLISSFANSSHQEIASTLIVFPSELLANLGIRRSVSDMIDNASSLLVDTIPGDLSSLDSPKYNPILSGIASGKFDIAYQLTQTLLLGKKVSGEIDLALGGLTPSLVRGASKLTIDTLKQLNIKASLPFSIPHAFSWSISKGTVKGVEGGKIMMDSAAPSFAWAYHEFLRNETKFKISSDEVIAKQYKDFSLPQAFDRDRAAHYRSILDCQWKSLVPSQYQSGLRLFTESGLKSQKEHVRGLIESITGKNFEIAIREMEVDHLKALYATVFSSFALLYVDDASARPYSSSSKETKTEGLNLPVLVEGHGFPYGNSYSALDAKQGKISSIDDFIKLKDGIYLRMIKNIPVATDELTLIPTFYDAYPTMYFSSNSKTEKVESWVLDDGLLHLAMIPMNSVSSVPRLYFTSKFTYLTMGVYLNMDDTYKPATPDAAREVVPMHISTKEWAFDRHKYFLEYKNFGSYGDPVHILEASDEQELVKDTVKKIENMMEKDNAEQSKASADVGASLTNSAKAVATEASAQLANTDKSAGSEKPALILDDKKKNKKSDGPSDDSDSKPEDK